MCCSRHKARCKLYTSCFSSPFHVSCSSIFLLILNSLHTVPLFQLFTHIIRFLSIPYISILINAHSSFPLFFLFFLTSSFCFAHSLFRFSYSSSSFLFVFLILIHVIFFFHLTVSFVPDLLSIVSPFFYVCLSFVFPSFTFVIHWQTPAVSISFIFIYIINSYFAFSLTNFTIFFPSFPSPSYMSTIIRNFLFLCRPVFLLSLPHALFFPQYSLTPSS